MVVKMCRRYWFWQSRKMLSDDVGYIVELGLFGWLRPTAVKFFRFHGVKPNEIVPLPSGWRICNF